MHEIIENELKSNNNVLIELPPIRSNIGFIKNNKSIFLDASIEMRRERFRDRNTMDSVKTFHTMNEYQTDCLLIKTYCDIIILNNQKISMMIDYFNKDIIKS